MTKFNHFILKLFRNESDSENPNDVVWFDRIDGLFMYTAEQIDDNLRKAGFSNIMIHHDEELHRFSILAVK
jgi:hypothetical protein